MASTEKCDLLFVAGEASGDALAARVAREILQLRPELNICALGGARLEKAGARLVFDLAGRGVVGFVEVLRSLSFFRQAMRCFEQTLERDKPSAVVMVDFPGFNFRAARRAHARGIPVIYYVSPQVWAWNQGRLKDMKRWVRKMLVLFPFEEKFYQDAGIPVEYAGHPMVEALNDLQPSATTRAELGYTPEDTLVGLLPGSRESELRRLLPVLFEAAGHIQKKLPEVNFILPLAETLSRAQLGQLPPHLNIRVIENPAYAHRAMLDFALTASGTATLENAVFGVPMAVIYRTNPLTYRMARQLIRLDHIGMVNILAGKTICREFIQKEATGENLARYACNVLTDDEKRETIKHELAGVRESLGGPGASRRAAESILRTLDE